MAITPKSYADIMKELTDALSVSTPQQLQSGSVLHVESIETIMSTATFYGDIILDMKYYKYPQRYHKLLKVLDKLQVKIP